MTRLRTEWISSIEKKIEGYNKELIGKTGCSLMEIAAKACNQSKEAFASSITAHKVAAIPITQGEGVIGDFSQSVAAILRSIGADAFVTDQTDVSGLYEAVNKGADVLFMADDDRYISLNIKTGALGDNNLCTAKGYVQALELMVGDLSGKDILVLGCGIVGQEIVKVLKEKKAMISVYDIDKGRALSIGDGAKILASKNEIKNFTYILDATNTGNWLNCGMLNESAFISTPGVPFSLNDEAKRIYEARTVHDVLHIGTAVMLGAVI